MIEMIKSLFEHPQRDSEESHRRSLRLAAAALLVETARSDFAEDSVELSKMSQLLATALKLGENCDVDVLLVHAPQAETDFVDMGFGIDRRQIMYNDFVLIGPPEDPAGTVNRLFAGGSSRFMPLIPPLLKYHSIFLWIRWS